jgi:hypothetical protein
MMTNPRSLRQQSAKHDKTRQKATLFNTKTAIRNQHRLALRWFYSPMVGLDGRKVLKSVAFCRVVSPCSDCCPAKPLNRRD